MRHKTVEIVLKRAEVDEGVVGLINWLNSFHCVLTTWSCQGDEVSEGSDRLLPYVSFLCGDLDELRQIRQKVTAAAGQLTHPDFISLDVSERVSQEGVTRTFQLWFSSRLAFKTMLSSISVVKEAP